MSSITVYKKTVVFGVKNKILIVLLGVSSLTLAVISCKRGESNSSNDKIQKGVQTADCIRKYDKDGCNICNRVGLTRKWECPTGVSCPDQSTEKAKENSDHCLQVCVIKTGTGGCNSCRLIYNLNDWHFFCTDLGCPKETKKDANKCTKDMSVQEFKILTETDFFDL